MKLFLYWMLSASLIGGCSTIGQSTLLGAGTFGALGLGVGIAAERSTGSALIGLGAGALIGAGLGYATHKDRERNVSPSVSTLTDELEKQPSISSPQIRRLWIPEKIIDGGSRYEEGHWIWLIEKPALWRKP